MRPLRARALRHPALLGLPVVVAAALALGGCHDATSAATPSSAPATPGPGPGSPGGGVPRGPAPTAQALRSPVAGGTGSDGLTVRYLDHDGTIKTVGVEDFPR